MSKSEDGLRLTWGGSFALTYVFIVVGICFYGATSVLDTALLQVAATFALLLLASAAYLRIWQLGLVVVGWLMIFLAFGGTMALTKDQPISPPDAGKMQAMLVNVEEAVMMLPYVATVALVVVSLVSCGVAARQLFRRRRSS